MNRHSRLGFVLAYLVVLGTALVRAGDTYVNMGSGAFLLGQPVVQIRVYTPNDPATPEDELQVYHPDEDGFLTSNSFILDTGANGLMIAKGTYGSILDLMVPNGFVADEAQYEEQGVAGSTMYGVSGAYDMDYAGSDGTPFTLTDVRFMCNAESYIEYDGIIGMPAMAGKVVHLDMSVWDDGSALLMNTLFAPAPPAETAHRYTIPLRMTHFPRDGQQNPGDPLPTWAPLPFIDAEVFSGTNTGTGSFLLDTGAQLSMINHRLAVAMGLDTNGNGMIDIEEAHGTVEVGGVGGTKEVPIVSVGGIRIPTLEGTDFVWKEFEVIVLDIVPGIDGIIGMDLLHSGWMNRALGDTTADPGVINHIYFDFRDISDDQAEMICYLHPTNDTVLNSDAPQVTVEPENGILSLVETIPFLITFDQVVTGFTQEDIVLGNGVLLGFETMTEGLAYRVTVQAQAPPNDGSGGLDDFDAWWESLFSRSGENRGILDGLLGYLTVRVGVPAVVAQSAAGHDNDKGVGEATYALDALIATLASTASPSTAASPIPFTLSFDGPVMLLTEASIHVQNGTIVNFQDTTVIDPDAPIEEGLPPSQFAFGVVPSGNGPVTVTLLSAVADAMTSWNTYLGDELTVQFTGFPEVTLESPVTSPSDTEAATVSITFSRPVVGFEQADLLTANADTASFSTLTPGLEYEVVLTPNASGPVILVVPNAAAHDAANGLANSPATFGFQSAPIPFTVERIGSDTFRIRMARPVDALTDVAILPHLAVLDIQEESPGVFLVRTEPHTFGVDYVITIDGIKGVDGVGHEGTVEFVPNEFFVAFADGTGESVLIGQSPDADDGLGDGFDQEGDGGEGDQPVVRILNTTGEGASDFLTCDFRRSDGSTERWFIEVMLPAGQRAPWTFRWQLGTPDGDRLVLLRELRDGAPYGPPIDMTTVSEVELDADVTFEILSGTPEEIPLQFQQGWNLVGTPLVTLMTAEESASDGTRGCILSSDTVTRFVQGAYEECAATGPLLAEGGYWVHTTAAATVEATVGLRDDGTVRLHAGWNLITPTTACTPGDFAAGLVFWRWDATTLRYAELDADDDLVPGVGYWVYAPEAQTLQFPEPIRR